MATPEPVTTGVTDITAVSTWDQYLAIPNKHKIKAVYARVRYTGSVWQVEASTDSAEIQDSHLAWDTNHLNIAVTGFTRSPIVQATAVFGTSVLMPVANAASAVQVRIYWYDAAFANVTTQATTMDAYVLILGV
jgi:hypothetical protein